MASEGGPDAEFHHPERIELLEALKTALGVHVIEGSTTWACLWLSDIDNLRTLVARAQEVPDFLAGYFASVENQIKIVQTCRFVNLIIRYGPLIL